MKRTASQSSSERCVRARHGERKQPLTLMGLPTELREQIWTFAVVDSEPLPAYIGKCTLKRPDAERLIYRASTLREHKLLPGVPNLAQVSKQVLHEVMPIFYQGNVFAFSLNDGSELWEWQYLASIHVPGPSITHPGVVDSFYKHWTARLEFYIHPVAKEESWGNYLIPASITVTLSHDSKLSLTFGEALQSECTCDLVSGAEWMSAEDARRGRTVASIAAFADLVDKRRHFYWEDCRRSCERFSKSCDVCDKPCPLPELRACTMQNLESFGL